MDESSNHSNSKSATSSLLDPSENQDDSTSMKPRSMRLASGAGPLGPLLAGLFNTWTEVSRLNYFDNISEFEPSGDTLARRLTCSRITIPSGLIEEMRRNPEVIPTEAFPQNVTPLMNEEQLWGCFYNFPELYQDCYSPCVRVLRLSDVDELVGGVLTRDMVAACLTYLHRTPILGDYVYIKLSLTAQRLLNIDVLQHYKYLVYLDLSSNRLSNLNVLSHLLYLQFLSVDFNRLETVLEYSTPQWFLTEVHYKYNSVKKIRDLAMFWSITILDLSHNNIKSIWGLHNLRYLRHLDLSFNHIQRLENLNHLRLLWLDVSYNNISSYELGANEGLWTLVHLEYLNLNENNLKSMKIFSGCNRLRELHVRNNRFGSLLELAVYMRQLRCLTVLDLRANPICEYPGYPYVVYDTFPVLLNLDAKELDPVHQRRFKMDTNPNVVTFACRRLLRMMYIEQLSRAHVPVTPPADTEEVPLIVFVGEEASGKGSLARQLAAECGSKIKLSRRHTTADYHFPGQYIVVSRQKFDDMLVAGELLTYSESGGESYGLSREEAFISDGKVRVCCMGLISALMLQLRGRRPYLILMSCNNRGELKARQNTREETRNTEFDKIMSTEPFAQSSALQVVLSGRIIINGILNEIITSLPEEKFKSEFMLDSQCSLLEEHHTRDEFRTFIRGPDLITLLTQPSGDDLRRDVSREMDPSLYSIYKQSHDSSAAMTNSYEERKNNECKRKDNDQPNKLRRTTDTGTRSAYDSTKSSKSVTFPDSLPIPIPSAEREEKRKQDQESKGMSVSKTMQKAVLSGASSSPTKGYDPSPEDGDLWLAFLMEAGLLELSDTGPNPSFRSRQQTVIDTPESILQLLTNYQKTDFAETTTTTVRDLYESIHLLCPGLFRDTITMDDPKEALRKAKRIIKDIVNSQSNLGPMFDIDFANNLDYYPTVKKRLEDIRLEIAPRQIFH